MNRAVWWIPPIYPH